VLAREGESLLDVAHNNGIDLEGACESSLACSTCHVILEEDFYDSLEEPCEEEEDLLDLAYGLTQSSRLGCQVKVTRDMENKLILLPSATRNFYVDKSKINLPDYDKAEAK
jgi:ferredoxin